MFEHPDLRTLARRSPDPGGSCAAFDELIEPWVDDALDARERARLDAHFASCAGCCAQRDLALLVTDGLRSLPAKTCPPIDLPMATDGVGARVRAFFAGLLPTVGAGRLATVAALLVAGLATALYLRPAPPAVPDEVAQAEAEVKLALAYLGRIGERTGDIVAQDVLEARVAVPIVRSIRSALATPEPTP